MSLLAQRTRQAVLCSRPAPDAGGCLLLERTEVLLIRLQFCIP